MNPLRKRFTGDTVVAQRYTGEAMGLLDAVYDQMRMNELSQLTLHKTLGNGVELHASSRFGQDEIRIHVTPVGGRAGGAPREYCIWEGDDERFTDPITGIADIGPCTGVNSDIVFGSWVSGAGIFPESGPAEATVSNVNVYLKSDISVPTGGSFPLDSNIMPDKLLPSPAYDIGGRPGGSMFIAPSHAVTSETLIYYAFDAAGNTATYASIPADGLELDKINIHGGYSYESVSYVDSNGIYVAAVGTYSRSEAGTYPLYMTSTTASDWIVANQKTFSDEGKIVRYALKSNGGDLEYPQDPVNLLFNNGSGSVVPLQAVCQNDNVTMWIRTTYLVDGAEQPHLYKSNGGVWTEVTPEGGWPALGYPMFWGGTGLLHDPVTDAIAMVKGDMSGAWIFNGKDCFGAGLAPFFREFRTIPVDYAAIASGDDSVLRDNSIAKFTQFYDAVIYASFGLYLSNYNGNGLKNHRYIGASYKVGKLKQKKVTTGV